MTLFIPIRSYQIRSVAQSCPTLCDPMNHSTPGLPVHHQPPEFTQTHVHRVSDAIQPSHPLASLSPLAPNPSQHQSLFQWVHAFSTQNHFRPLYEYYWQPLSKVALKCGRQSRLARDDEGVILCMAQGLSSMLGSLMDLSTQATEALGCCTGSDTE